MNLIKRVQQLKGNGKIALALKDLETHLSNSDLCKSFETALHRELETKRLEYKAELLKWDKMADHLYETHKNSSVKAIYEKQGIKHVEMLVRSMLRSEDHWDKLTEVVRRWLQDDEHSKQILEKNFSYELAMLFLTLLDYDRARIYIEKETSELLN